MAKSLKYVAPGISKKEITKEVFELNGVSDQDGIEVEAGQVVEVSDAAAELLMHTEPDKWEEATETSGDEGSADTSSNAETASTADTSSQPEG